jgi:predicted RNA-binding Zn ribbon-like protein
MAPFEPLGEPLALELANTVVGDGDRETDLLRSATDVAGWIGTQQTRLPIGAAERPPSAVALRRLRAAIRSLVDAALEGRPPDQDALARVNAASAAAPPRPQLAWNDRSGPHVVERSGRLPQATLATIARSAVAVLGGEDRDRLRRCAAPGCVRVFVAASGRRRWCSSATCGNRVRAARHYARRRATPPQPAA